MKHQVLAITGCIATASATGIANTLPENPLGFNLGEISTSSFINKPFKGVIPLSYISYASAKNLTVNLASEAVFKQIGADKHPVLSNLNFQVAKQNGKAVILISSDQPIQLPFLNFVLEIKGPEGTIFQDYTVLLDPESTQPSSTMVADTPVSTPAKKTTRNKQKYKVRSGDTLFFIARSHRVKNVSLKKMRQAIYSKNPRAFIKGDVNKIKRGYTINLPTKAEIDKFEVASSSPSVVEKANKTTKSNQRAQQVINASDNNKYTVAQGDTLSKITRKFVNEENSFTKLMNAIYANNPDAFVGENKSLIKEGAELKIPLMAGLYKENNIKAKEMNTDISVKSSIEPSDTAKAMLAADESLSEVNTSGDNTSSANISVGESVPESELAKRIRELRKELEQSKDLLSNMEKTLSEKETLLQEKNNQLNNLKEALQDNSVDTDAAVSDSLGAKNPPILEEKGANQRELISSAKKLTAPQESIAQNTEIKSSDANNGMVKLSSIQEFIGNNYAYLTLASVFGLLLIGYRRKSRHSYSGLDDSNNSYTSLPDDDTYVLKEKNINFYDPKMDEDFNYETSHLDVLDQSSEADLDTATEVIDESASSHSPFEERTEFVAENDQSALDDFIELDEEPFVETEESNVQTVLDEEPFVETKESNVQTAIDKPFGNQQVLNENIAINLDEGHLTESFNEDIQPNLVDDISIVEDVETSLQSEKDIEIENAINDPVLMDYADLSIDDVSIESDFTIGDEVVISEDSAIDNEQSSLLISDINKDIDLAFPNDDSINLETDFSLLGSTSEVVTPEDVLFNDEDGSGIESELARMEKVLAETNEYLESTKLMESDSSIIDELTLLNTESDSIFEDNSTIDLIGIDELLNASADNTDIESTISLNEVSDSSVSKETLEDSIHALNKLVDEEETQQIEHCDDLITEFYNGMGVDEKIVAGDEWNNIEKVCDNYIDQYKNTEENKEDVLVEEVTDFNHMMTDLLESLDKVDDNLKKAMINKSGKDPSKDS